MKTPNTLIMSAMSLALLCACSAKDTARQADSNFEYLDVPQIPALAQDEGLKIPTSQVYVVPENKVSGKLGSKVDIRPPVKTLTLISGTRTQYNNQQVVVWMASQKQLNDVWTYILRGMKEEKVALREQSDSVIETDWIDLSTSLDEDQQRMVRYRVETIKDAPQKGINITLVEWKDAPQNLFRVNPEKGRRYTIRAANQFLTFYDLAKTHESQRKAQEMMRSIPMQMGVDTSALPIVIARLPFDVFWQRIPMLLKYLGMEIDDMIRSQGLIEVKYTPPNGSHWEELGVDRWSLRGKDYQLHIGDLKNRTSISLTNGVGKPVSEKQLKEFMVALKAATDYDNAHPKAGPKR